MGQRASRAPREVFVFGSNLLGVHGAGAALHARLNYGALAGRGEGFMGNCYAIPTKSKPSRDPSAVLPLEEINKAVQRFIAFARKHTEMRFILTEIGCGLAGYKAEDIAPMFQTAPRNVRLPVSFKQVLGYALKSISTGRGGRDDAVQVSVAGGANSMEFDSID